MNCRLRYFDPTQRRNRVHPDVAALVDRIEPDSVSVTLVNLHPSEKRDVIVQAGAFGEHRFTTVKSAAKATRVDHKLFRVRLRPGAVGKLVLGMKRFVNAPSYAFPWHGKTIPVR